MDLRDYARKQEKENEKNNRIIAYVTDLDENGLKFTISGEVYYQGLREKDDSVKKFGFVLRKKESINIILMKDLNKKKRDKLININLDKINNKCILKYDKKIFKELNKLYKFKSDEQELNFKTRMIVKLFKNSKVKNDNLNLDLDETKKTGPGFFFIPFK